VAVASSSVSVPITIEEPIALVRGAYDHLEPIETPPPQRELTVEEKIRVAAEKYGYNPDRAVAIAKAESNLMPNAKNSKSSASGLYQFINSTFLHYCVDEYKLATSSDLKNDPDIQIECAVRMLSEGKESHWNESRHVWVNNH
jgi:hypothetical protein